MVLKFKEFVLSVDFQKGEIASLMIRGSERLGASSPLFCFCLRDREGKAYQFTAYDARACTKTGEGAIYTDFPVNDVAVHVYLREEGQEAAWRIAVTSVSANYFVEWVDVPLITLPKLEENNTCKNGGSILFPYNEGALVSDIRCRERSWFHHSDAEYPSKGSYAVFPNMICSQMLAYLWKDAGLYIGAHDEERGVKEIDFYEENGGVTLRFRLFCGTDFGEDFTTEYPIIFAVTDGNWEAAAERYRQWFERALPPNVKKISENDTLPEWYADSPIVVSYPVRGIHDMDEMKPNALYPYTNALPMLEDLRKQCGSRLLVLLMHWEGTAPWAPPYVWPPFGDTDDFHAFLRELHAKGDLLGVYCSGFGYTVQSHLIADYNKEAEYAEKALWHGMCAGPDGRVAISEICQGQRSGYDICPASEVGKAILKKAYAPLFESELDYIQILDQNHGGGQYFCYSREHGHAPGPGAWMTTRMQQLLTEWNELAGTTLFGCESAAAEPFVGNLLFSDNRYELNYDFGKPVPLYAYLYHEYVRNFMGNQVCCPFRTEEDTLRYRIAYSFSVGDSMTLVLTQDGELMSHWGMREFSALPDKEKTLRMIGNLTKFYKTLAKPYLYAGRMIRIPTVECPSIAFMHSNQQRTVELPAVLATAWEAEDGSRALILVNPVDSEIHCKVNGDEMLLPALDAAFIKLS